MSLYLLVANSGKAGSCNRNYIFDNEPEMLEEREWMQRHGFVVSKGHKITGHKYSWTDSSLKCERRK
jgi:hypothetical protein